MLRIMLIPEDIEVSAPVESNENTVSKQNLDVEVNENEELDYEMENSDGVREYTYEYNMDDYPTSMIISNPESVLIDSSKIIFEYY